MKRQIPLEINPINLYNTLGQLERIPGYIDQPMEFADTGLLAGYTLANGAAASFDYDDKYRVKSISHNDAFGDEALAYNFRYDKADNLLQRNQEFFSYDRKGQLLSAALTGEAAATEYELDATPQTGEARNDILGSRELVIPGENLTIDWGAGSVGIDLGYAYKVKRFTIGAAETALPLNKETLAIYSSVYNAEGAFKEEKFSLSEDSSEGSITIELEAAVFARFLKIHSHVNPLNAEGAAIEDEGVFTVDTDAVTVTALTGGRNEFYSYRKDGNREAVTIMAEDFDTSPYSYYPGGDLIKTAGAYAFVYDANGNLTERGDKYTMSGEVPQIEKSGDYIRYEYDLLNRLVAVERLNDDGDLVNVARYRYNANGLRVLRTDKDGEETRYVFDLDGNVIEEHTGGEVTRYVFRKNKHLARVSSEGTFFYGTDHLGSTVVITDETGATVWKGDVSPFGDRTTGDGSIEAQVKYTGKDMDDETGLYYFNARWYDPVLGRFTSEDPARDGANWFVYVNNNPLRWIDPSGMLNIYFTEKLPNQLFPTNQQVELIPLGGAYTTDQSSIKKFVQGAAAFADLPLPTGINSFLLNTQNPGSAIKGLVGIASGEIQGKGVGKLAELANLPDGMTAMNDMLEVSPLNLATALVGAIEASETSIEAEYTDYTDSLLEFAKMAMLEHDFLEAFADQYDGIDYEPGYNATGSFPILLDGDSQDKFFDELEAFRKDNPKYSDIEFIAE